MHRVPRRSSRHVSGCVAAGRGRRRRSRSCIPRCKAAPDSAALGCFLFVRTRPASSPPPHVSRAPVRFEFARRDSRLRPFPPFGENFPRRVTVYSHSLSGISRARGSHTRPRFTHSFVHTHDDTRQRDVGASTSYYSDTMSCEERTAVRCTDSVELGSTDDDVTRRRDTTAPRQKFD